MIKTYQDFEKIINNEETKKTFILEAINEHKTSKEYQMAKMADDYDRQLNTEIMNFQKYLRNIQGGKIVDIFAPNNKIASNYFNQFTNQENEYLLSNGIDFEEDKEADKIKERLTEEFDTQLSKGGKYSLIHGASYGFWNNDKIVFFKFTEFVPILDESTGGLRAGIRFWQLNKDKPLMITLYEEDGITEYKNFENKTEMIANKKSYIIILKKTNLKVVEEAEENYFGLPIIPIYTNEYHDSRLIGMKNTIDLYDRIFSEFGNDFDRYQQLYWVFKNCGGMSEQDIGAFMTKLKIFGGADVQGDDNATAEAKKIEIPYEARKIALEMLEKRIYKDYGAIDISDLSSNATQDEINAKYMPLDLKVDGYEYYVREFMEKLLDLLGFENVKFKFHRDKMESKQNETDIKNKEAQTKQIEANTILSIAEHLDDETFIKILIEKGIINVEKLQELEKNKDKMKYINDLLKKIQEEADNRIDTVVATELETDEEVTE